MDINGHIEKYFKDGFTYLEIIEFLRIYHHHHISLSTLKRQLRRNNRKRRALAGIRCSRRALIQAIEEELTGSGSSGSHIGYRRIHRAMLSKGLICRREDVRKIMKYIDPEGVSLRRRRRLRRRKYTSQGPNYVWHVDGHDKLKPFGFSIHGCIDGFSRRLH